MGPDHSLVRKAQAHKRCITVPAVRFELAKLRKHLAARLKAKKERQSDWCSPDPAPDGGGCWEIPVACVMGESGGSWTADNPTSDARGPYQLLGHGEPWPVLTRRDAMAHHRIAEALRAQSGMAPWVHPAC